MSVTTRWVDTTENTLDGILEKFLESTEDTLYEDKISYINIQVQKKFDNNIFFEFKNRRIEYNVIEYTYDSISPGEGQIEDRKTSSSGLVIVYSNSGKVNYIINKNSNALTELRWLIGYKGKLEIEKNESNINSELLIWIISRLLREENELSISSYNNEEEVFLILNSIVGFKGKTDDQISFVTADGDSILNILSTLSFLLESKLLQQIKLRLQFDVHDNIELTLKDTKTIDANINKYDGPFDDHTKFKKIAEIYLLIYLEIMPMLYLKYQQDVDNESWGTVQKKEFLTSVRDKLIENINQKVSSM
ncbi:hypothetical protein [Paenibacillus campi]|uniref:hypothetical protein n=1 Tax=Paenibacillus campi TaxID=3106031 RepID=UPI002AFF35E1|nr:hypothetical protein [Paenibacillus sp. SGZ-1014]